MARGELAKRIAAKADESRSGLYRWIKENYAEIALVMPPGERKNWKALCAAAVEAGIKVKIRERDSDPPTFAEAAPSLAAVRSAFLRVEADLGRIPKPQRKTVRSKVRAPFAVAERSVESGPATSEDTQDPMADIKREMNKRSGRKD